MTARGRPLLLSGRRQLCAPSARGLSAKIICVELQQSTLADISTLVESSLAHCGQCMKQYAAFVPFCSVIMPDDTYRVYSSSQDQTEGDYEQLLGQMAGLLGAAYQQGQIRASALGVRVAARLSEDDLPQDALLLEIEHQDGFTVKYFVPIDKRIFGPPRLGKPQPARHEARFVSAPGARPGPE